MYLSKEYNWVKEGITAGMNGKVDSLFGQTRVFSIDDENVSPDAIEYLRNVRNEALTISAISMNNIRSHTNKSNTIRHDASIYDDESDIPTTDNSTDNSNNNNNISTINQAGKNSIYEDSIRYEKVPVMKKRRKATNEETPSKNSPIPENLINFNQRMKSVMIWFQDLQVDIFNLPYNSDYSYDHNTLELLLFHIQRIVTDKDKTERNNGVSLHLANLLKDWVPSETIEQIENNDYIIDVEWIQQLLIKLQCVKIPNIEFLKCVITGDYSNSEPHGYYSWNQFLLNNEPCKDMFNTMINSNNIWLLVKYMTRSWLTEITEKHNHNMRLWLIYILIYLPSSIVANNTSTLRDLGKKCREIILTYYHKSFPSDSTNEQITKHKANNPLVPLQKCIQLEFKQFTSKEIPENATLLELTIYIIATKYGQRDLIQWDSQLT